VISNARSARLPVAKAGAAQDAWAVKTIAPGFLISMPQLGDPNFNRAVILMLEHDDKGSMGLVVNKPAPLTLDDLAQGQGLDVLPERRAQPMFMGGPVEPQRGFVLHDQPSLDEKHEVLPGLYLSLTLDSLRPLLMNPDAKFRFCLGYAGWGPKQLDGELAAGSWLFTEATGGPVLELSPDKLWEATLRTMGVDPAMLLPGGGVH